MFKNKKITVIGLGYVGLPLAILAEKKGYEVAGIVKTSKTAELINNRKTPFSDKSLQRDLKNSQITVGINFEPVKNSSVVIICVPTPITSDNKPDLSILKDAATNLAGFINPGQLIILESTVNPGISEEIVIPIIEKVFKKKCGRDFFFAHCPERINPGDKKWTINKIPRVVGGFDEKSRVMAEYFYNSILSTKVYNVAGLKEAEASKIVENAFRDINIAFVNELALSFQRLGIDVVDVINAAATKPFGFMPHFPGAGVGGHCIPVDPYYLIDYASKKGFKHDFLILARKINNSMPKYTVDLLLEGLREKKIKSESAKVLVLGIAYKAGIDDTRESPALKIIQLLKRNKINVKSFDPNVPLLSSFKTLDEALSFADSVIIATAHKDFIDLPFSAWRKFQVVIDGRNCLDKKNFLKSGIYYRGIGR